MTNTLATRIAKASREIGGALATDKRNLQAQYDYISADKILDRAGQVLAGNGIVIIPAITATTVDAYTSAKGATYYGVTVNFAMTITDGDTTLEFPWVGMGNDYSVPDKALYKAITSGHKYFLVKLLNIGAGNEDGEHEAAPPDAQASAPRAQNGGASKATGNGSGQPARQPVQSTPVAAADNPFSTDEAAALRKLNAVGADLYGDKWTDDKRHDLAEQISKKRTRSSKQLTLQELESLTKWMSDKIEERKHLEVPA
jgi:hypothetical protein